MAKLVVQIQMHISQTSNWLMCPHTLKVRMSRRQDIGQLSKAISEKEVVIGYSSGMMGNS